MPRRRRSRAGRLRHFVTFYNKTSRKTDADPSHDTVFLADVPCRFVDVSGLEKYRGRQRHADVNVVIETRWYDGIKHEMIAKQVRENRVFYIKAIYRTDDEPSWAQIHATETRK